MAAKLGALIAELDGTIGVRPPEQRSEILRQVTSLFLSEANRLDEAKLDFFDNVLVRLIDQAETHALAHLSKTLSAARLAPPKTVRQLALHEDASVAAPVLERSDRLSENDLVQIVDKAGPQHLLAIARRLTIGKPVTDALVNRGDSLVHCSLADNRGARLSEAGAAALAGRAEHDLSLAELLLRRSDVPVDIRRKLFALLENARLRSRLAIPPTIQEKIQVSIDRSAIQRAPTSTDYAKARAKMSDLNRTGKLSDSAVNRFAVSGEYTDVVAALSFLSGSSIEIIEPLVRGGELEGLVVACKASRLSWATTKMIILNRPDCSAIAEQELERNKEIFATLSLSAAQRTVRLELGPRKEP